MDQVRQVMRIRGVGRLVLGELMDWILPFFSYTIKKRHIFVLVFVEVYVASVALSTTLFELGEFLCAAQPSLWIQFF